MTTDSQRELSIARAAIAGTRHDLGTRLQRVVALGAPSRLIAEGAAAARETATEKAWQVGQRALGVVAARGRHPGVIGGIAGAMAPIVYLLLRRRRRRRIEPQRRRSTFRHLRSPLMSVLISAATLLLRRGR